MTRNSGSRFADNAMTAMARSIPLALALLAAIFLVAPMAIIVPMSFSRAISFEFPPPGYWTGYYAQYFANRSWLDATAKSPQSARCWNNLGMTLLRLTLRSRCWCGNRVFGRSGTG